MIRIVIGVMFAIIIFEGIVSVANESSSGCYVDIATVKSWIEPPTGFSMKRWKPEEASVVEKSIMRSGDSVGFGIARAYSRRELRDPDRLDRVLSLMRLSFSAPKIITSEEDKSPTATMLLLFALKQECEDINLRQKIIDAEIYINEQLAKSEKKMEKRD